MYSSVSSLLALGGVITRPVVPAGVATGSSLATVPRLPARNSSARWKRGVTAQAKHKKILDDLASKLFDKEVLSGADVDAILQAGLA